MTSDQSPNSGAGSSAAGSSAAPVRPRPAHTQPLLIVVVVIGGMLGTAARYALAEAIPTAKDGWPIATLMVNLVGAFVLGLLLEGLVRRGPDVGLRRQLRLFAGTGFCGGFTTYSALAVELDILLRDQQLGTAGGYAGVTLVGGALVTVLGILIAASHHRWRLARLPPDPDAIEESE